METYRARVNNTVVLQAPRRPSSALTAIGEGLGAVGRELQQMDETNQRAENIALERRRSAEIAAGSGNLAQLEIGLATEIQRLRGESRPGADGHEDTVSALAQERVTAFVDSLSPDEEVRNRLRPLAETAARRAVAGEVAWASKERATYQGEGYQSWQDLQVNEQRRAPDPIHADERIAQGSSLIDALDVPGTAKEQLKGMLKASIWGAQLQGMLDSGQAARVKATLATGAFDWMDPKLVETYRDLADNAEQMAARQTELQATETRKTALEGLKTLKARISAYDYPSAKEITTALAVAKAAGVPDAELIEFSDLGARSVITQGYAAHGTAALEAEADRLHGLANAGRLNGEDRRKLDVVEQVLKDRSDRVATNLAPLLKGGVESRVQGVAQLAGMSVRERWAAAEAANDPRAAIVASLGSERGRIMAIQGSEIRKARPADFLPARDAQGRELKSDEARRKEADAVFRATLGPLVQDVGGQYENLREVALDLMAARGTGWNAESLKAMTSVLFGAQRRRLPGGGETWQGGIGIVRGFPVELPPQWTAGEFDKAWSQHKFPGLIYANGKPALLGDVRKNYRPRHVRTDEQGTEYYAIVGPNGRALKHKNGQDYELPVSARPPKGIAQ